jgi:hypothetical protein
LRNERRNARRTERNKAMNQPDAYEIVFDPHVLAALIPLIIAVVVLLFMIAVPIEGKRK